MLLAMFNPAASLARLGLLLCLLLRHFGQPRAMFVRTLARAERELAAAIRATLAACGQSAPEMDDAGLIAWFGAHRPGSDERLASAVGNDRCPGVATPLALQENEHALERRFAVGQAVIDRALPVRYARAPP